MESETIILKHIIKITNDLINKSNLKKILKIYDITDIIVNCKNYKTTCKNLFITVTIFNNKIKSYEMLLSYNININKSDIIITKSYQKYTSEHIIITISLSNKNAFKELKKLIKCDIIMISAIALNDIIKNTTIQTGRKKCNMK